MTIKGTGNIKYITEPEIEFPHGFDEYTPRKEIDAAFNGSNMTGTAKIDYTIVPQEMGKAVIPSVPFVYFNPSTKEYVTLSTKEYNVNIGRGANAPASVEQKAIDKSMSDILHIKSQHAPAIDTGHYVFNTFLVLGHIYNLNNCTGNNHCYIPQANEAQFRPAPPPVGAREQGSPSTLQDGQRCYVFTET